MTKINKGISLYYALLCVEKSKQCLILGIKNNKYNQKDQILLRLFSRSGRMKDKIKGNVINLNYSGFSEFKFILPMQTSHIHFSIEYIDDKKKDNGWILLHENKYFYNIDTENDCYLNSRIQCMVINPLQYTKYALILSNDDDVTKCLNYLNDMGIKKIINNNHENVGIKKIVVLFEKDSKIFPCAFKKSDHCDPTDPCNECFSENPLTPCDQEIIISNLDENCNIYKLCIVAKYRDETNGSGYEDVRKITYYASKDSVKDICTKEYHCPPNIIINNVSFSVETCAIIIRIILNESLDRTKIHLGYSNFPIG